VSAPGIAATQADPLEWPSSPWECAAPESYVLLHFQKYQANKALKLGVLELIARKKFTLVDVARRTALSRRKRDSLLTSGTDNARLTHTPLTLASLRDVFTALPSKTFERWDQTPPQEAFGVLVSEFATGVVKQLGGSVDGYVDKVVRPTLVERGWVLRESYRVLGVIPAKRWALTTAGVAAQGDLLWRIQYGNRELGKLVDDDPARAVAFLGLAGAAVLLMDDARPHLQRLRERLEAGAQPPSLADTTSMGIMDGGGAGAVDLGGLDGAGGLDLGALDAVDAAFSGIDAGVDAGAGGGDGGSGGDGGGGSGGD